MSGGVIKLAAAPMIISSAAVVGKREHEGPLGGAFDYHDGSGRFGEETWEKSESAMQRYALNFALSKAKIAPESLDVILAGDLINQCTCSAQGLLAFDVPYLGLFGACSTIGEALLLSSLLCDGRGGYMKTAAAVTSSHYCTAERQFRMPLEYGGQRSPTAQWTVTGSGAFVVAAADAADDLGGLRGPYIAEVLPGRTVDGGITDSANMGAAMAPAAIDTLRRFFEQTSTSPADYDMILTGDLGAEGHSIVIELMAREGYDLSRNYNDCGLLIYSASAQDVHSGGSGCGCSATVLAADILPRMNRGEIGSLLFITTGALMSPTTVQQGLSIPGIAHLVHLTNERMS